MSAKAVPKKKEGGSDTFFDLEQQFILRLPPVSDFLCFSYRPLENMRISSSAVERIDFYFLRRFVVVNNTRTLLHDKKL